jgi:hypothetical protein
MSAAGCKMVAHVYVSSFCTAAVLSCLAPGSACSSALYESAVYSSSSSSVRVLYSALLGSCAMMDMC